MLYKNDIIFELSRMPKEVEKVERYFHNKFPVKVVYPPERIVKSRLPHNRLPDKPNSISFDLKSIVKTDTGTEVWRYAEEVLIDDHGNKKYTPKKFRFSGSRYLTRGDIDLIYFLLYKSEYCKGGVNQGSRVKFMFEDLVTEAEKKAEKKALEAKIGNLLYSKEYGLDEEKLRAVAKAYFIKNVDTLTLPQVRILIEQKIHASKGGTTQFFDMVDDDIELNKRNSIQRAIDKKIIFYDMGRKSWFWNTAEGKTELICKVPPSKSDYDAIYDVFTGNQGFRDNLESALKTPEPKSKKGKVMAGENVNEDE